MRQPPLWPRVIFVDWHGVLSRDPFWVSIRQSATHPLHPQLEAGMAGVFANESAIANEWMKGLLSCDNVIAAMDIQLDRRFRDDFLTRRLDIDCERMTVNVELFETLRMLRTHACIVLATDNMDCFARTFDKVRARRRSRPRKETLADWAVVCDDIICSSNIGALKAENPAGFFGPWLDEHGLNFTDAALIDDRADNCAAFADQGGTAVRYKMTSDDVIQVVDALSGWFDRTRWGRYSTAPIATQPLSLDLRPQADQRPAGFQQLVTTRSNLDARPPLTLFDLGDVLPAMPDQSA